MKILFTNDDGVHASGLQVLYRRFHQNLECWISAPKTQQSAQSHAFSIGKPLKIERHASRCVSVDGTPADSVYFGMHGLNVDGFEWVLSGINAGSNLGTDVHYSGTVGAAMEGCFHGAHALAISLHGVERLEGVDYTLASDLAYRVFHALEPVVRDLPSTCWNLNVPYVSAKEMKEVRVAQLAHRKYHTHVSAVSNSGSEDQFVKLGGPHKEFLGGEDCDGPLLFSGHPTLTQLHWDWSAGAHRKRPLISTTVIQESLSKMV